MEMTNVKSEINIGSSHHHLGIQEGKMQLVNKCVKRRRRSPSLVVVNDQIGKQQQVDQSNATATTTTVKRSSRFRGVSRHRWTGRFEAHLWDKGSWNATQRKKGKQVYLGAYDEEESAARAYDLAAIKYWGTSTCTNFPISEYDKEIEIMQIVTKEEYLASLRRRSSGFSRGVSKYRGVSRHHHNGRWEARIGRVFGNKYLYLGTYSTQEEAARAYDIAATEYRGINAVTNFDLSSYIRWLRPATSATATTSNALVSQPLQITSNHIYPNEETEFSFHPHSFNIVGSALAIPEKQGVIETKIPLSPNSKLSSPTALGLLLRSSMFRELVEKNSNASTIDNEEIEGNEMNNQLLVGNEEDFGGAFYHNVVNANDPYLFLQNPKSDKVPALESQGENRSGSSLYNGSGQTLWSSVFNMPPPMY